MHLDSCLIRDPKLPAQGVTTLQFHQEHQRYVNHLLYASPVRRGKSIEMIEGIIPIHNANGTLRSRQASISSIARNRLAVPAVGQ
jgi:hypothetical protein